MTHDAYEEQLAALLRLIQGTTWPFSQGLCTYPRAPDADQQALHAALLELERRGHVIRQFEEPIEGWVGWMPAGSSPS